MIILFESVLESYKLDYCLPFYFNIKTIYQPVLKYLYKDDKDTIIISDLKLACKTVIEQLSISLFIEGRFYGGRKLLQTIWYPIVLESLPRNNFEIAEFITEHHYYSLAYRQYGKSLLDIMIHVQEQLLMYFISANETNQNILLLRSLGHLYYIKSLTDDRSCLLKALDYSLITTVHAKEQQIRSYLAFSIYLCNFKQYYEKAITLLETAINIEYKEFNNDFITLYSSHKLIYSDDIQSLLQIYNAINISTKTYILYLMCRLYKYTNKKDQGRETFI
ncbi:unnamed protein product, partial [Didymodactylos carnosus]